MRHKIASIQRLSETDAQDWLAENSVARVVFLACGKPATLGLVARIWSSDSRRLNSRKHTLLETLVNDKPLKSIVANTGRHVTLTHDVVRERVPFDGAGPIIRQDGILWTRRA